MNLSSHQNAFLSDVSKLIQFCENRGIMVTAGELFRTDEQQAIYLEQGKTKATTSNHQRRLAIDLNFIIDGQLTYKKEDISPYGQFWEELNPGINRWGGNFSTIEDTDHFERNV
jgi:hypothetical protein